jgi:hypothetical protein
MKKENRTLSDPPIVGALISSAMSGINSALSSTASLLNIRTPIICGLVNNSPYELIRISEIHDPVHGYLKVSPSSTVLDLIHGAVKGTNRWKESNYTTWGLDGRGSGTEVLVVYHMKEINIIIALYAGNSITGNPFAGANIIDEKWFVEIYTKKSNDHKGKWLIDHIKDIHSTNCQFSINGNPCKVSTNDGLISIEFASAEETLFKVKFNGEWENSIYNGYGLPKKDSRISI